MEALIAQTHVHVLINGGGPVVAQFAHCLSPLLLVALAYHGGLTLGSPETPRTGDTVGDTCSRVGEFDNYRKTGVC